jgi:soluble lytic murein transglycosylase-like protein
MDALKGVAAAIALAAPGAASAQVSAWRPVILEASQRFAIPASWIERVMLIESGGRAYRGGRPVVSPKGAMGLMQLMPATWTEMRSALALGNDPLDAHDNIIAGAAYLRLLYDRFGYPGLFAAYNAGPDRYRRYIAGSQALPRETVAYLGAATAGSGMARTAIWPAASALFAASAAPASTVPSPPARATLFAIAPRP